MKAQPQAPKLVKRCVAEKRGEQRVSLHPPSAEASFEKQIRYSSASDLLFAYRTEEEGRFLYILPDALTVCCCVTPQSRHIGPASN